MPLFIFLFFFARTVSYGMFYREQTGFEFAKRTIHRLRANENQKLTKEDIKRLEKKLQGNHCKVKLVFELIFLFMYFHQGHKYNCSLDIQARLSHEERGKMPAHLMLCTLGFKSSCRFAAGVKVKITIPRGEELEWKINRLTDEAADKFTTR